MTLTYLAIQERLEEIENDLAERAPAYEQAAEDAARCKRSYEKRLATARLAVKFNDDEAKNEGNRNAKALLAVAAADDDLYEKYADAEGRYEAQRAAVKVLETRATIGMALLKTQIKERGG